MQWTIETKLMLYDWNAVFDQRKQLYEIDYRVAQRKHHIHIAHTCRYNKIRARRTGIKGGSLNFSFIK